MWRLIDGYRFNGAYSYETGRERENRKLRVIPALPPFLALQGSPLERYVCGSGAGGGGADNGGLGRAFIILALPRPLSLLHNTT